MHPWECCSTGACNVFCCNCGGPCRANTTVFDMEEFLPFLTEELGAAVTRPKRAILYSFDPEDFNVIKSYFLKLIPNSNFFKSFP